MLPLGFLVALGTDVAIVEGPARARARRPARFHVTLLHAGGGRPVAATVHFGDGSVATLRYGRGAAPNVFDAEAAHAFASPGRYAISVRTASGRLLASERVTVDPAPVAARPRAAAASSGAAGAGAPLIVAPGASAPADPRHAGILVVPGLPAGAPPPILVPPAEAGVPAASTPADLPSATLRPRASLAPASVPATPPSPSPTPRVTTGDR